MGWGRTLLLGDIGNRLDIADTEAEIGSIKRDLRSSYHKDQSQDSKLDALVQENAELKLYLASVIRILSQQNIITADQLKQMVAAIDAEDGKLDGRSDGPMH
jgi:hypothetical protein